MATSDTDLSFRFVMAPPGIGEDTHRTWESIILGAVEKAQRAGGEHICMRGCARGVPHALRRRRGGEQRGRNLYFRHRSSTTKRNARSSQPAANRI